MSFVSVVARENFITVVSDGLAIRDGVEVHQNFQKFKEIGKDQFIAFTGIKEAADDLVATLGENEERYNLLELSTRVKGIIDEKVPTDFKMFIAIGGISDNGGIELHAFSNQSEAIQSFAPTDARVDYIFLESSYIDQQKHNLINNKFVESLGNKGLDTSEQILQSQFLINDFVSDIDFTVNKVKFSLVIEK